MTADPGTVVAPIPDHAREPENAAARIFGGKPDRFDTYRDAAGRPLFHVCRWDKPGGKVIRPLAWVRYADGHEEWASRHHPTPRPLFGLDTLAARPEAPVVIVEGEKKAEAAAKICPDSVVVTWPAGSGSVDKAGWSPLALRTRVLIWPDADKPGIEAAATIVGLLSEFGEIEITVVDAFALAALSPDGSQRPVDEGWDADDAITEWEDVAALRDAVLDHARLAEIGPRYRSFDQFTMSTDGLSAKVTKGRGGKATTEELWISSPFEVIGRVRDPLGNGWAKLIRWCDEDGRSRTHVVADADIHADPRLLCSTLAGMGLKIARGCGGMLADYLNAVAVRRRVTTVERTGWHEISGSFCFVLPGRTIGAPTYETVILSRASAAPFEAKGSLDDWQNGVGRLVRGHPRHVLMVSAAFAGPLLALVKQEGGGLHLHGGSSTGKSTAIEAAASAWGRGSTPGYVRSWRATANALEAEAGAVAKLVGIGWRSLRVL